MVVMFEWQHGSFILIAMANEASINFARANTRQWHGKSEKHVFGHFTLKTKTNLFFYHSNSNSSLTLQVPTIYIHVVMTQCFLAMVAVPRTDQNTKNILVVVEKVKSFCYIMA